MDGGQVPVDNLHEALLEAEQALSEIDEELPDPLTLNSSLTELRATYASYTIVLGVLVWLFHSSQLRS